MFTNESSIALMLIYFVLQSMAEKEYSWAFSAVTILIRNEEQTVKRLKDANPYFVNLDLLRSKVCITLTTGMLPKSFSVVNDSFPHHKLTCVLDCGHNIMGLPLSIVHSQPLSTREENSNHKK